MKLLIILLVLAGCTTTPAQINKEVNGYLYMSDARLFGVGDYWQLPSTILGGRIGDCEDLAIAKAQLLMNAGVPEQDLTLLWLISGTGGHMVLEYQNMIYDNNSDRVLPTQYWIMTSKYSIYKRLSIQDYLTKAMKDAQL